MASSKLLFRLLVGACVATVLMGCEKSDIDPEDSSPPSVVIKVRGDDGQYHAQSSVNYQGSSLNVVAVAEDPQGVKAIKAQYVNTTSQTCTVGSTVYTGSYSVSVPPPEEYTLSGSSAGEVPTVLPLFTSISGPFSCSVPGVGPGIAISHVVKLRATGTNWSSNPQVATAFTDLDVKVQP